VTPGEVAGIIGAVLAVGALAERVASRLAQPAPTPPRETALPPAPPHASQPSLPQIGHPCEVTRAEFDALRKDVEGLETRERAALQEAARLTEQIKGIRAAKAHGGDRGSST
jgi:hypothetical protein